MIDKIKDMLNSNWNDMRIDTAVEDFEDYLKYDEGLSDITVSGYLNDLKIFLRWLDENHFSQDIGKIRVTSINKDHAREFLRMYTKKYKARTRNRKFSAINRFFNFLEDNNNIRKHPMEGIKKIKVSRREPIYMTKDEISKFLEAVENSDEKQFALRNKAMMMIFLYCGLRISGVRKLNIDNIDLDDNVIRVIGKGDKERVIPLHQKVQEVLREYLNHRDDLFGSTRTDALFLSQRGNRICQRQIANVVDYYVKKTDIDKNITPHKLRHSFASWFYTKTKDIRSLQHILGHNSISTTEIYTHTDQEHVRKQINSLNLDE